VSGASLKQVAVLTCFFSALPLGARAAAPGEAVGPEQPANTNPRPWAENVPAAQQEEALRLFGEGNKLFEDSQHVAALAKYREALKVWDHPAIRYNAAVVLIHLDQPLAAYENLEPALRYGDAPLGIEIHQQALTYRKLLVGQLANLKVTCAEQLAEVSLDGRSLFVAPGEAARWLLPGTHQLVARKGGFQTETRSLTLLPGKQSQQTLTLQEIRRPPTKTVRRWPVWRPWTVLGAGALLALAGVPIILDARSNIDAYDRQVAISCTLGCSPGDLPQTALDARDRGRAENVVAVSLFVVGGALAAGGIALLIANQPRVVPAEDLAHVSAAPLVGPGLFGVSVALRR
jgi:hypothetical protein